jgi:hypothetical protein
VNTVKKRVVFCIITLIILFSAAPVFSADLLVPIMELVTRAHVDDGGSFVLDSMGLIDLSVAGGYKIGGNVVVSVESNDLTSLSSPPYLQFRAGSAVARNLFTLPLNVTFFIGEYETFANGDLFPKKYGTVLVASKYRGYFYFPEGVRYDGIYTPVGTGVEIETSDNFSDTVQLSTLVYQDSNLGKGFWSADLRTVLNFEQVKLDTFFGYSFPISQYGYMHTGILFHYNTGIGSEFLMQVGIPKYDFYSDPFSIKLFYFFFEPRVHFDIFSVLISLFWHPEYYQQQATNELGNADVNVDFRLGNLNENPYAGGLETILYFQTSNPSANQIQVTLSPYFSAITSGTRWNLKMNFNVFPFSITNLFECFIGVTAEF